jgi:hypothetical protein
MFIPVVLHSPVMVLETDPGQIHPILRHVLMSKSVLTNATGSSNNVNAVLHTSAPKIQATTNQIARAFWTMLNLSRPLLSALMLLVSAFLDPAVPRLHK